MLYTPALVLACLVLSLGLVLVGCGGESSDTETTAATATGETTATTAGAETMGTSELVDAILATWAEAVQKLNTLLEGQPGAGTVKASVEALKEEYVQKLVEFGYEKEAMSESDKAQVDSQLSSRLVSLENEAYYATYMENWEAYAYASGDVEFTNLLASFNVLTQYADFELLKAQLPEEAARLGIE
jgi:hypothetical protein